MARRVRKRPRTRVRRLPAPPGWSIQEADPAVLGATGAAAYADEAGNAVRIPGADKLDFQDPSTRFMVANEVANLLDYKGLSPADRRRFARIMGVRDRPWDGEGGGRDSFSDYYATAALGNRGRPGEVQVTGDTEVVPRRLRRFQKSMERYRRRNGSPPLRLR